MGGGLCNVWLQFGAGMLKSSLAGNATREVTFKKVDGADEIPQWRKFMITAQMWISTGFKRTIFIILDKHKN